MRDEYDIRKMDLKPNLYNVMIRRATTEDAEGIITAHISSIRGLASPYYSEEIIKEWSKAGDSGRLAKYREFLGSDNAVVFVAVLDKCVVGFSELIPEHSEVRAVYVTAEQARKGIGSRLLDALEMEAVRRGLQELQLSASINALDFYLSRGYQTKEKSTHKLRSGIEMPCYKMQKGLRRDL